MAEDDDMFLTRLTFVRSKASADRRLYSEDVKVVRRDLRSAQLNRFVDAGERWGIATLPSQVLEDRVLLLPIEVGEGRDAVAFAQGRFLEHSENAVRVRIRQRLEQHA